MNVEERRHFIDRLFAQGLTPIVESYQNASTARGTVERFDQWMYVYEVTLKSLTSLAWSRSHALDNQPPELLFFVRDSFRQTSQGHWLQLLTACRDHLKQQSDRWGRHLDGILRKKLRDESLREISRIVATLLGHTPRNDKKVSLLQFMQTLTELRNKTKGHGAPRRHFYEDINLHLEAAIDCLLRELKPFILVNLLYVQHLESKEEKIGLEGLLLQGTSKRPWQREVPAFDWLQPNTLLAVEESGEELYLFRLEPLFIWDERRDAVGIYNSYVENRQQFEYLAYARGEPIHVRGRSFEAAFGLPSETPPTFSRGPMKLWSDKGVALYPVDTALVGQNQVFNALVKFRRKFSHSRIASFFALIGDWGLGKSRIGFELFAESFGHVDQWLLNSDEYILANVRRVLSPSLADGILPLFIRYDLVCDDDLYADNWISRVATDALALVVESSNRSKVPNTLLSDVQSALLAKGVELSRLQSVLAKTEDYDARLQGALELLKPAGIEHLWIVVDELETITDYRRGLREESEEPVAAEWLTLVADVFRHENYRAAQPFYANVHFLLLCSEGMRDKLQIGPSRRRDDVLTLTPNRLSDVRYYIEHLKEKAAAIGQVVDYPAGTVEAAFLASNRNFGWFNVIMSSIHESYQRHLAEGRNVNAAQLIEEFARSEARAGWVFDTSGLELLKGAGSPELLNRLVFGQLPIAIGVDVTESQANQLQQARLPGLEVPAFAELVQVHLDARSLADELTRPEVGFRLAQDVSGDFYDFYNTRLSVTVLLAALQAFSVTTENSDILIYTDRTQFAAQLKALYPEPNIEQAADALHQVFMEQNYQVSEKRYLATSFPLLQRVDRLLNRETQRTTFFRSPDDEPLIERYVRNLAASDAQRQRAVCEGFAKLLDDSLSKLQPARGIQAAASVTFTSTFQSPRLDSLRVTRDGRLVVTYCLNAERLAADLSAYLGQQPVHPIVVLLPAHTDPMSFEQAVERMPLVQRCVMVRRLNTFEEEFLQKYSARGSVFEKQPLSDWTHSRIGAIRDEWKRQVDEWHDQLEASGYLLRPIWYSTRGFALDHFHRAYRLMLANDWTIDRISPEMKQGFDARSFDQVQNACRKNVDPPAGKVPTLPILSDEPYRPTPPPAFGALFYELRQQASLKSLADRFFFAVPDKEFKAIKQLEQILELLRGLGLVTVQTKLYRAVNSELLRQYIETTSAWLSGPCRDAISEIKEYFLAEAQELEVGELRFAGDKLPQVEKLINQTDFTPLARSRQVEGDSLRILAKQVQEIELALQEICPPSIYRREGQTFQCSPEQIRDFQARYYGQLSLWEKVKFLQWLRQAFAERRDQIKEEIRRQLNDAQNMQEINGYPFPVAALTMPLKAVQQELDMALTGESISISGRLNIRGYPYEIRRYLLTKKYEDAWYRLEAVSQLVEHSSPKSIWSKFKGAYDQWEKTLRHFEQAKAAWTRLSAFMVDAPESAWKGVERVRADYQEVEAIVNGSLVQTINNQTTSLPTLDLLDELSTEVDGYTQKIEKLSSQIATAQSDLERHLKKLINHNRVRALNEILRASGQSEIKLSGLADTYGASKRCFEAFNSKVNDQGLALLDQANRETTWALWLEIYQELENERYMPKSDHRTALDELEEMGIIIRTVKLRR